MVYKVGESLEEINPVDITSDNLVVGLVTKEEMKELGALLGFDQDTIDASQRVTTRFFPLTILVGWYGMNFAYMPELRWKYGYLCFIVLSAIVITILLIIGKKKKWF